MCFSIITWSFSWGRRLVPSPPATSAATAATAAGACTQISVCSAKSSAVSSVDGNVRCRFGSGHRSATCRVPWLRTWQPAQRLSQVAAAAAAAETAAAAEARGKHDEEYDEEPVAAYVHLPFCKVGHPTSHALRGMGPWHTAHPQRVPSPDGSPPLACPAAAQVLVLRLPGDCGGARPGAGSQHAGECRLPAPGPAPGEFGGTRCAAVSQHMG